MAAEPGGAAGELAPAKVNLFLHVRGRRADGYHLLDSLAVFPRLGDLLTAEPAAALSLAIGGPFARDLPAGGDNLVLRAAAALSAAAGGRGAALRLEKNLPVASGIGGGSADAAAALRLLARLWRAELPDGTALALGADVPVCLDGRARLMGGIGERLAEAPPMPPFWLVLANPLAALPTAEVFAALASRDNPPGPAAPARFAGFGDLVAWLAAQRNDLEAPALALRPETGAVLAALGACEGAALARMSGSGATSFAMFEAEAAALAAAARLRAAHPAWWVAAAPVLP